MGYQPRVMENAPPPPYCSVVMASWDRDRKAAVKELAEALGVHWTRVFTPVWEDREEPDWASMGHAEAVWEQVARNPVAAQVFYGGHQPVDTNGAVIPIPDNVLGQPVVSLPLETKPNAVPPPTEPWSETEGWIYSSMLRWPC